MMLRLTTLAPQTRHRIVNARRFPWSQLFDRIFRNEGVTGSHPVSSTFSPCASWRTSFLHFPRDAVEGTRATGTPQRSLRFAS